MNARSLASRLQSLRLRTGMTQAVLAKKCGLSESTISAAETGRRSIRFTTILKICQGLGIPAELLVQEAQRTGGHPAEGPALNRGLSAGREARFKELLDIYLEGKRNLFLFLFDSLESRPGWEGSPLEHPPEPPGRQPPSMGARARSRRK